jgi:hypothetical protein
MLSIQKESSYLLSQYFGDVNRKQRRKLQKSRKISRQGDKEIFQSPVYFFKLRKKTPGSWPSSQPENFFSVESKPPNKEKK